MMFSKNDIVYCDANFLVAYGSKKVKQPEIKKRARILFANLLISECKIIVSALTFDETWLGIRTELGPKKIFNNSRFIFDKFLEKVGIRLINRGVLEYSYSDIYNDLDNFTIRISKHKNFSIVQFDNADNGVRNALLNLKNFKLKPRDSFHLALAKDNNATHLISNDNHFKNINNQIGVNIIDY